MNTVIVFSVRFRPADQQTSRPVDQPNQLKNTILINRLFPSKQSSLAFHFELIACRNVREFKSEEPYREGATIMQTLFTYFQQLHVGSRNSNDD